MSILFFVQTFYGLPIVQSDNLPPDFIKVVMGKIYCGRWWIPERFKQVCDYYNGLPTVDQLEQWAKNNFKVREDNWGLPE